MRDAVDVIVEADTATEAAHQRGLARIARGKRWRTPALTAWVKSHGIDPNVLRSVDIQLDWGADTYTATFHCFALNDAGKKYLDPDRVDVAMAEPITVDIAGLPPVGFFPSFDEFGG